MRQTRSHLLLLFGLLALGLDANGVEWQTALREQTDPAKLATLGKRGANPRVNRIVFYLHQARSGGNAPAEALDWAFGENGTTGLVATLSKETQLLNYKHAVDWGLLTEANLEKLRRGQAAKITKGRDKGEATDVDHIVPISLAPEAGNSLANLELQPASANRSRGASIGLHELRFAGRLQEAGIIGKATLWQVRWAFFRRKLLPVLLLVGFLVFHWRRRRLRAEPIDELLESVRSKLPRGLFPGRRS